MLAQDNVISWPSVFKVGKVRVIWITGIILFHRTELGREGTPGWHCLIEGTQNMPALTELVG